jgi:hypothetical protein
MSPQVAAIGAAGLIATSVPQIGHRQVPVSRSYEYGGSAFLTLHVKRSLGLRLDSACLLYRFGEQPPVGAKILCQVVGRSALTDGANLLFSSISEGVTTRRAGPGFPGVHPKRVMA